FVSAKRVFGPEIARTDAVSATEQTRGFFRLQSRQNTAKFLHLMGFAERDANISRERIVSRKTFVGALDDNDVLFAAQRVDNGGFGERADNVDMNRADFGVALLAQIVAGSVNVFGGATKGDKDRVCVLGPVFG